MFTQCEFGWVHSWSKLNRRLMYEHFPHITAIQRNASLPRKRPKKLMSVAPTEDILNEHFSKESLQPRCEFGANKMQSLKRLARFSHYFLCTQQRYESTSATRHISLYCTAATRLMQRANACQRSKPSTEKPHTAAPLPRSRVDR